MGYAKERDGDNQKDKVCVVEALDPEGRTVGREAFPTQAEGDAYAATMKARGFKVSVSPLDPIPEAG